MCGTTWARCQPKPVDAHASHTHDGCIPPSGVNPCAHRTIAGYGHNHLTSQGRCPGIPQLPSGDWHKIWSTNPLERLYKKIKRRTRLVRIFPDDAAIGQPRGAGAAAGIAGRLAARLPPHLL